MGMRKAAPLDRFRFRKLLEMLEKKEGRGTELISVYIPPGKRVSEVMNDLRSEWGTASNIKSKTTRKNVQDALTKVMERLKLFKEIPETGLAIFAGNIAGDQPGVGRMETYVVIPPEPITTYYYRCEHRFVLEPLWELLRTEDAYGIVVIDAKETTIALAKGRRIEILKEVTSGVPGKHRAGGQSARRFERLREMALNEYYRRVGEHINELYLKIPNLKGIIFGGPGPTKNEFLERDLLHYELKDKVLTVVDTAYTGIEGVKEVVDRAKDFLEGLRYSEERRIVQEFLKHVGRDTGLATYGDREVMRELRSANVRVLLLSEGVEREWLRLRCRECGYMEERIIERSELESFMEGLANIICPRCGKAAYEVVEHKELLERLIEMADEVDARVEVISTETEEGEMLLKSFGGVAAILRHRTY